MKISQFKDGLRYTNSEFHGFVYLVKEEGKVQLLDGETDNPLMVIEDDSYMHSKTNFVCIDRINMPKYLYNKHEMLLKIGKKELKGTLMTAVYKDETGNNITVTCDVRANTFKTDKFVALSEWRLQ